jgi:RNA polymerase sigma factor (sigma-70 family)
MSDPTSSSLLLRLTRPGEEAAWRRFIDLYTPLLFSWASRMGFPDQDAADLVQDVFVVLVQKVPQFRYDPDMSFRSWLRTVAENSWRDALRKRAAVPKNACAAVLDDAATPDGAAVLWETEYRQHLLGRSVHLMRTDFEERTWKACWALVVEGKTGANVASELGMGRGRLRSQVARAPPPASGTGGPDGLTAGCVVGRLLRGCPDSRSELPRITRLQSGTLFRQVLPPISYPIVAASSHSPDSLAWESLMNALSGCPGATGLKEYLLGRVSDRKAASVEAHLATCPECRELLPDIRAEDDFVADFRAQARHDPLKHAVLDRLAAELRVLLQILPTEHDATPVLGAEGAPGPDGAAIEEVRSLLALPQRPDELGRLGDYRVLKVLGSGGMGVVFLAEDTRLRRHVALKVMKLARAACARDRQRFLREAQLVAALTHDNVVAILQIGEERGTPFLAMPLLEGESLEARLKHEGRLPPSDVLRIGREAAEGLAAVHARGLVHRDVKPSNLWLEALPGGHTRVKVLDFGLARNAEASGDHLTETGVILGTPAYMAPEQATGRLNHQADLFSLGCVLYRMTTGQMPFPGTTPLQILAGVLRDEPRPPSEVQPDTSLALSNLILRLLQKDPARRPASASEVIQALQSLEQDLTCKGEHEGQKAPRQPARRRRLLVAAALALLAGSIGVGAVALVRLPTGSGEKAEITSEPAGVDVGAALIRNPTGTSEKTGVESESARVDDAWVKRVAALPAEEQVKAVAAKLKEVNPGFDGQVKPTIEDGVVTGLEFVTDDVTAIWPVRALTKLKSLVCRGHSPRKGRLADLSPLKGMSLKQLQCYDNQVSDLRPLEGMPLTHLYFQNTQVSDLAPLKGIRLNALNCGGTRVASLSPVRGMPLLYLGCRNTLVDDLSPLERMIHLAQLDCRGTRASDLLPLKGLPLTALFCDFNMAKDTEILRSLRKLEQINGEPAEEFWKKEGDTKRDQEP